jgi:hypothetical protein
MADYNSLYTGPEIDESIGRVLNNEVGGMVLIPDAVSSLKTGTSSSDILSAFGGEEAFKNICKKVSKGIPPYFGSSTNNSLTVARSCFNFSATVDEDANNYTLTIINLPNPQYINSVSRKKVFTFSAGSMSLTSDLLSYNFANIYYVSVNIASINTSFSHQQILDYLGLDLDGVKELALKAKSNDLTIVSLGTSDTRTSIWNVKSVYTDASNWVLNMSSSSSFENDIDVLVSKRLVIQCTNNILSCTNNESTSYQRNRVRGSLSISSRNYYNILRCPLNASENTCSGMVTITQRISNLNATFLTFYFCVIENNLHVKVLQHTNTSIFPSVLYTSNSNEGYLAVEIDMSSTLYYDVSVALETNCYLLSDHDILKPYSNLGNQSIVNF